MVNNNTKKVREYNNQYLNTNIPRPSNEVPYLEIEDRKSRRVEPVHDTDDISYSTSRTDRRGIGGKPTIESYGAAYMRAMDRNLMDGTKDALWRRYKRQAKDADYLYRIKKISDTNPAKMTPEDVHNFLMYRRSLEVSDSEMIHEMAAMSNLFRFIDNKAYQKAIEGFPYLKVSAIHTRLESMSQSECAAIIKKAMEVDMDDWPRMTKYATVIMSFGAGLRSKELRLCDINCINTSADGWTVDVLHPKGEGKYGEERVAPIIPEVQPFLKRYFVARAKHIENTKATTYAFITGTKATDGYLSANSLRKYADDISVETGIDVDLRKCRRTYGQILIDMGVEISKVSVAMGHKSTRTTEQHYARVKGTVAVSSILQTFGQGALSAQNMNSQMPVGFDGGFTSPSKED